MTANVMKQQMAIEETYEDVKLLIWSTCHKFRKRYNVVESVEELFSIANLSFMNAYHKYKEGKATFSTWVRWYVWHDLLEIMRKDITRNRAAKISFVDMIETDYVGDSRTFNVNEFLDSLSEEAQFVVDLVIDTPEGLAEAMRRRGNGDGNTRLSLKQFLAGMDWSCEEITNVFSEISNALKY